LIDTRYEHPEALAPTRRLADRLNDPAAQGHIPGAVFVDQAAGRAEPQPWTPLETQILGSQRFVPATDCFVLQVLRHNQVSLHGGSWTEWGTDPDLPLQAGPAEKNPVLNHQTGGTDGTRGAN